MCDGMPIDRRVIFERDVVQHDNNKCYKTITNFASSFTMSEAPCNNKERLCTIHSWSILFLVVRRQELEGSHINTTEQRIFSAITIENVVT